MSSFSIAQRWKFLNGKAGLFIDFRARTRYNKKQADSFMERRQAPQ
jgi:hypothetical protein